MPVENTDSPETIPLPKPNEKQYLVTYLLSFSKMF